jgi:hypothetical protein
MISSRRPHAQLAAKGTGAPALRNKLAVRFKFNPDSAALVRQSFWNADGEKRPRGGLEVLSGRFRCVWFPGLKPWAILCSPFGRGRNVQTPVNKDAP